MKIVTIETVSTKNWKFRWDHQNVVIVISVHEWCVWDQREVTAHDNESSARLQGGWTISFIVIEIASKICINTAAQRNVPLGVNDKTIIKSTFQLKYNLLQSITMSLTRTHATMRTCINCASTLWMIVIRNALQNARSRLTNEALVEWRRIHMLEQ